ncbi:peptidoglycan DD-metalloendopeptidase family protein, partial [Vibrio furnissii]
GQIDWKGLVIDANYGQPVKAVYPGTVVFAEYLRGYGLVVLLDHGKGDMTLYGFNQTLMKKEGDKVAAGETLALAGDTGGQSRPALYFEIRRNSKAENPRTWLTR